MFGIKKKEKKTSLPVLKETSVGQSVKKPAALPKLPDWNRNKPSGLTSLQTATKPATAAPAQSVPVKAKEAPAQTQSADALLRELTDREDFSYDPQKDPLYDYYRQEYLRNGALAMEDAMGQAAGLTGGYGNSYAQIVGQQVYGDYVQGLGEVIPELYQLAWNQYQAEGDALKDKYLLQEEQERRQEQEAFDLAISMLYGGAIPSEELLEQSGMDVADAVSIFEQANPDAFSETGADMVYYTDPNGTQHIGYVIDGVTYTDPQGNRPIPVHSTVTLSDGSQWYKDNGGSVLLPVFGSGMGDGQFRELMEELSHADSYEQINELLNTWSGQMSQSQWQEVESWLEEVFGN